MPRIDPSVTRAYPWSPWFAQTIARAAQMIRSQGFGASILYRPGPPDTVMIEVDVGDTGRVPTPVRREFVGHPNGSVAAVRVPPGAEDGVDDWGPPPATEDDIFRLLRYWLVKKLPPYHEVRRTITAAGATQH